MFKQITILCLVALAGSVVFCRKEAAPQPEPRWLRIYYEGVFDDSINITGWEINEDVVWLRAFYYPWQGEDSIDYNNYFDYWEWEPGPHRCWFVLNVNGRLVGVDPNIIPPSKIEHPEWIITLIGVGDSLNILKPFPNVVGVTTYTNSSEEIETLASIPSNLRLYVECSNITNRDLRRLARFSNIRALHVERSDRYRGYWSSGGGHNPTRCGFRALRRMKELRVLWVHGLFESSEKIDKYLKGLPKLRQVKVWVYDILGAKRVSKSIPR